MANYRDDGSRIPRITFQVPVDMLFAAEALAAADYCNISTVCRRALAETLMQRGYMQEPREETV